MFDNAQGRPSHDATLILDDHEILTTHDRDGEGSSRRRHVKNATLSARGSEDATKSGEHKMWPSPWLRANWDPLHPPDLNKHSIVDAPPFDSDEPEPRAFQPDFAMDLNNLVESLWTPPVQATSTRGESAHARRVPQMRRQRSVSPQPPPQSRQSYDVPSSQRLVPEFDTRHSANAFDMRTRNHDPRMSYDAESHRRDPHADPRMSHDTDSRRRESPAQVRMSAMESRSRPIPPPSVDYPSSRRHESGVPSSYNHHDPHTGTRHSSDTVSIDDDVRKARGRSNSPQGQPQLRRITSAPSHHFHHPEQHYKERPVSSQRGKPTLGRANSEPVFNEEDESLEL